MIKSTTEITSNTIPSDNPLHQRLLSAYLFALPYVKGKVLEIGCGVGRGVEELMKKAEHFTAIDKNVELLEYLQEQHPEASFQHQHIPPLEGFEDNQFDTVVSFQVIEHIPDDDLFLKEIQRVLKPGGVAIVSTPNIKQSLTRNPWHIREYTAEQLQAKCKKYFSEVEALGVTGNDRVMEYHERNRESVKKITRFDVFNLQYKLPAALLRIPYDILNRMNRNKLADGDELVASITHEDYLKSEQPDSALDLFYILKK